MSDYIKRKDAIVRLWKQLRRLSDIIPMGKDAAGVAVRIIEDLPAADVVEVLRCKDCEFWNKDENILGGMCDEWSDFEDSIISYTKPDDYCSRGEREEEYEQEIRDLRKGEE